MKMLDDRANSEGLLFLSDEELRSVKRNAPITDIYDVEDTVFARGKFATVRRANHKQTGAHYAAKYIRKRRRAVDVTSEIRHEIAVLRRCAASGRVVRLHEVYETASDVVLVLELAAGGELQRVFDADHCLTEAEARRAMRQILEGLGYLHERHIAHLDLKPQNLLLAAEDSCDDIKLCDFGVSRLLAPGTEVRALLGTPDYVAPEVLSYEPISLATDIWSVGVLAYVLLSGYTPFGADTKQETYLNISQCLLTFEPDHFGDVSGAAIDFITSSLRVNPRLRPTVDNLLEHPWLSPKAHILPPLTAAAATPKQQQQQPPPAEVQPQPQQPPPLQPPPLQPPPLQPLPPTSPAVVTTPPLPKSAAASAAQRLECDNEAEANDSETDFDQEVPFISNERRKSFKAKHLKLGDVPPSNLALNESNDNNKNFAQCSESYQSPEFEEYEEFGCPLSNSEEDAVLEKNVNDSSEVREEEIVEKEVVELNTGVNVNVDEHIANTMESSCENKTSSEIVNENVSNQSADIIPETEINVEAVHDLLTTIREKVLSKSEEDKDMEKLSRNNSGEIISEDIERIENTIENISESEKLSEIVNNLITSADIIAETELNVEATPESLTTNRDNSDLSNFESPIVEAEDFTGHSLQDTKCAPNIVTNKVVSRIDLEGKDIAENCLFDILETVVANSEIRIPNIETNNFLNESAIFKCEIPENTSQDEDVSNKFIDVPKSSHETTEIRMSSQEALNIQDLPNIEIDDQISSNLNIEPKFEEIADEESADALLLKDKDIICHANANLKSQISIIKLDESHEAIGAVAIDVDSTETLKESNECADTISEIDLPHKELENDNCEIFTDSNDNISSHCAKLIEEVIAFVSNDQNNNINLQKENSNVLSVIENANTDYSEIHSNELQNIGNIAEDTEVEFENLFNNQIGDLDKPCDNEKPPPVHDRVFSRESLVDLGFDEGSLETDEEERFLEDGFLWEHNQRSKSFETALQKFKSIEEKEIRRLPKNYRILRKSKVVLDTYTNYTVCNNIGEIHSQPSSTYNNASDPLTSDFELSPDQTKGLEFCDENNDVKS